MVGRSAREGCDGSAVRANPGGGAKGLWYSGGTTWDGCYYDDAGYAARQRIGIPTSFSDHAGRGNGGRDADAGSQHKQVVFGRGRKSEECPSGSIERSGA